MATFPNTPTGNDSNDIKILFDRLRVIESAINTGDLDSVTSIGSVTDNTITIGRSLFFRIGGAIAELRLTNAGRLELYVNSEMRQSW